MKRKRLIAAAAVCLVLAFTAGIWAVKYRASQIKLSDNSVHVTARYTEYDPKSEACERLVQLTEEELFSEDNTAVFKGTVSEIRNVDLRFNRAKSYCAIAEIKVEKVYRGPCGVDSTVAVMVPTGHIDVNAQPKKTLLGTVSAMRVGMTGIFMPYMFDENSVWEENGAKLSKRDLAEYGFGDCTRFAFLETKKGLLFDRNTYESMADAEELGEIEEYVQDMIRKTS